MKVTVTLDIRQKDTDLSRDAVHKWSGFAGTRVDRLRGRVCSGRERNHRYMPESWAGDRHSPSKRSSLPV